MGASSSKESTQKKMSFGDKVKASVEEEIAKRAMMQREVQMAVNIAKARDAIQIFGSAWLTLLSGASIAKIAGKPVPGVVAVPVVVGGFILGNMADMAYGNKLQRVTREAEYILDNEKERFVPFPQAIFANQYTAEQKAAAYDKATPVGELWPSSMFSRK